jgi:hypothetical protein
MNEPIPDDPFAYHEFEIRRLEKELKAAREVVSRLVDTVKDAKELDALGYDHFPIDGILSLEKALKTYEGVLVV